MLRTIVIMIIIIIIIIVIIVKDSIKGADSVYGKYGRLNFKVCIVVMYVAVDS
jgi:hypothetical protein